MLRNPTFRELRSKKATFQDGPGSARGPARGGERRTGLRRDYRRSLAARRARSDGLGGHKLPVFALILTLVPLALAGARLRAGWPLRKVADILVRLQSDSRVPACAGFRGVHLNLSQIQKRHSPIRRVSKRCRHRFRELAEFVGRCSDYNSRLSSSVRFLVPSKFG
jgi:hypothetical protein